MTKVLLSLLIVFNAILLVVSIVSWNLYIGCFALAMSLALTRLIKKDSRTL